MLDAKWDVSLSFRETHIPIRWHLLGTSACGNGFFYCANEGHVPARIKTSRVNDGVCDPDCCDGSDEYDGREDCPNVCEEVGAEAKQERERLRLIQQEGSQLRKEYIEFGKSAKSKMELDLALFQQQTADLDRAVEESKSKQRGRERFGSDRGCNNTFKEERVLRVVL